MSTIEGYAALVTGGGSGIGRACAEQLAADGCHVTICGRTESKLTEAVARIRQAASSGVTVQSVVADVTREEDVARAVATAAAITGGLDILVANAGGSQIMGPIVLADLDAWRATLELNVIGTMLCIKHAAPVMARRGRGAIIGMSSLAGVRTHKNLSAYCAGKAGIDMLCRVAADELGPSGIRVNTVRPGFTDTELMEPLQSGDLHDDYVAQTPLGRTGKPEEVAALVRFLAGPESAFVTGQAIGVDGGQAMRRGPNFDLIAEPVYGAKALRGLLD